MKCANPGLGIQPFCKTCLFFIFQSKNEYMFQLLYSLFNMKAQPQWEENTMHCKKNLKLEACVAMHKHSDKPWPSEGLSVNGPFIPVTWHRERCPALFWHHTRAKTHSAADITRMPHNKCLYPRWVFWKGPIGGNVFLRNFRKIHAINSIGAFQFPRKNQSLLRVWQ